MVKRFLLATAVAVAACVATPAISQGYSHQGGVDATAIELADFFYTESQTALAASATFTGAAHKNRGVAGDNALVLPAGANVCFYTAEAFSDVAGTLYIDKSTDGTTWRQVASVATPAGSSASIKVPVSATYYRTRFVNGATAQATFLLTSASSLN